METVVGIIASPRRMGNCETIIKAVSRAIDRDHRLELLRLTDFRIEPCRACYLCLFENKNCPIQDDLGLILDTLERADAIILAAPAYFMAPHSSLKRLVDRGLSFYSRAEALWQKPAIGIGLAGIRHMEGYTLLGLENFLKVLLAKVKGIEMMYGALPGQVLLDNDNIKRARLLGRALFGPDPEPTQPCCPLCGGKTFRFLDDGTIRCMLCSNTGKIDVNKGKVTFRIEKGEHVLFLSPEEALAHKQWLIGMKQDFIRQKKSLFKAVSEFRNDGVWIKPSDDQDQ